jgi:hypothetical protein
MKKANCLWMPLLGSLISLPAFTFYAAESQETNYAGLATRIVKLLNRPLA